MHETRQKTFESSKPKMDHNFNPFEIANKPERQNIPRNKIFATNKSKSDLGFSGNFLSRVEDSSDNVPNRHSEALKYNCRLKTKASDSESKTVKSDKDDHLRFSFE